ncbi:putative tRNA pseudouridine synthase Pus10 [Latimeria chalumnae]|uniref:tRNA pseudouridine synthase Pus10 n=1 Tax=Latimeria chalumnae TaxID=7897 RepID=H3AEV9_LATCH|nr:PREDICTED: putative tRNA pseudouridine synthase Pus10 [Latimeria chalumnae]XP_006008127.1 PREDICTED: putative tRNA pseudouridine synthase Pus10 [Latimeria chalumnae]XP_006008128.1 PREDICTED: putative tRNA pseudouridine synthase Pus10 [Latimeria chalumnae]|eukprot:XP_006008125.1 PREDICTED: putative tRNA pseudouridine synthase Pus10 [Latimeria chalumnae]
MFPLKENDRPVAQVLVNAGCCPRCVLRFCCIGEQTSYRLPYEELVDGLQKFLAEVPDPPCKRIKLEEPEERIEEPSKNGTMISGSEEGVPTLQSSYPKICVVCLGILQRFCEKDFVRTICERVDSTGYQFSSFTFSVSFPPQLLVREHAMWLCIKQEMGRQGLSLEKDDVVQIKEAYKWIIHPLLSQNLGVPSEVKSLFDVSVVFTHTETDGDCHFLASVCRDCFKPTKNKQSVFTRMAVVKALEKIKEEDFRKQYLCPPDAPKDNCVVQEIQCTHAAVYVAGRYNKYSRTLPQTPWVIEGERKMESSVEELISAQLMVAFKAESFNFSSSGREDVDVRTLGNGRPFAVEVINPHRISFTQQEIKELQQKINSSSDKIKVRDLQLVTREAVALMKEGEEAKTKCYSALIWTQKVIQKTDIEFLNDIKELKIDQKTPLRVLHRRPLAVRPRLIHTMRSDYIDEHHFQLYLKTQAGTYIKEFVHGDFGRTKPNLGSLMKTTTDILELDVESVDVDWPPALDD